MKIHLVTALALSLIAGSMLSSSAFAQTATSTTAAPQTAAPVHGKKCATGKDCNRQPHMRKALRALENAKDQLQIAERDKGGHRDEALEFVNKAIEQVQQGVQFDDRH